MKRNKLIAIVMTTVLTALCAFGCGRQEKVNSTVVESITVSEAGTKPVKDTEADETGTGAVQILNENMTTKDLYYAYLMNTVVPQKQQASEEKFPMSAENKGEEILTNVSAGLVSAYIGDLDGDGSEDMITVTLDGTTMGKSAVGTLEVFEESEPAMSLSVELYTMKDRKITKVSETKGLTTINNAGYGTMIIGVQEMDGTIYIYGRSSMYLNEEEKREAFVVYCVENGKLVKVDNAEAMASLAEKYNDLTANPEEDLYILGQIDETWCTYVGVEAPMDGYCNVSVKDHTKMAAYLRGENPEAETETEAETSEAEENAEENPEENAEAYVEEYVEEYVE